MLSTSASIKMELTRILTIFIINILRTTKAQDGLLENLFQQTNFLLFNSSNVVEDTATFLPSYDFIIVGSGSGGW